MAYVPLVRRVRSNDIQAMLGEARASAGEAFVVPSAEHAETAARLGKMVTHTLSLLPTDSRCLIRSIVTVRMLARRSIPAKLVIGVRDDVGFAAHAWVEYEGRPVLPANGFQRLTEL